MPKKITTSVRQELVKALRQRYQLGTRAEKGVMLREFVAVSGYHRKHAIRLLGGTAELADGRPVRQRPRVYDEAVRQALTMLLGSLGPRLRKAAQASSSDTDRRTRAARTLGA